MLSPFKSLSISGFICLLHLEIIAETVPSGIFIIFAISFIARPSINLNLRASCCLELNFSISSKRSEFSSLYAILSAVLSLRSGMISSSLRRSSSPGSSVSREKTLFALVKTCFLQYVDVLFMVSIASQVLK